MRAIAGLAVLLFCVSISGGRNEEVSGVAIIPFVTLAQGRCHCTFV